MTNKKYTREELQQYAKEHFCLDKLAKEWEGMFYQLIEEKKTNPIVPYQPTRPYQNQNQKQMTVTKLNIACGPSVWTYDWINIDKYDFTEYFNFVQSVQTSEGMPEHQRKLWEWCRQGNKINFTRHDCTKPFVQFKDNSIDFIYGGQMIEHLSPLHQAPFFLKECLRMLKPGGVIRLTTPDLNKLLLAFNNNDLDKFAEDQPDFYKSLDPTAKLSYIMFGTAGENCTQEHYEGHFFCYSEKSITDLLMKVGFKDIEFVMPKQGKNKQIAEEIIDFGVSHSLIVEAIK